VFRVGSREVPHGHIVGMREGGRGLRPRRILHVMVKQSSDMVLQGVEASLQIANPAPILLFIETCCVVFGWFEEIPK
jgi:hypothetical protein